ncbi:MAG: YdcH family protein [Alphaproteobacteria bacterium]|nr:YdcH family protein [Alphaproteobacteria bacterium]
MSDRDALEAKLIELKTEHRDLDDVIARMGKQIPFDQLLMQRLKKRKLQLKDAISRLQAQLVPDIIA